ncbi:DUF5085 family protein [Peribacillus sp. SCS-26]|uniref:DUF5085 family protein n=1 Tax=Paraperibacillus marinus TaxID=3115295 RepID=UPI003905C44F
MTILENHQIAYKNTASKLYSFYPEEMNLAIEDFRDILIRNGYSPAGQLFFSIISDPAAEVMTAELFFPLEDLHVKPMRVEDITYRSYFCVNGMIMTRITGDFEEKSQAGYWSLLEYLQHHELEKKTPVFVEYKQSHRGELFAEMSVGAF